MVGEEDKRARKAKRDSSTRQKDEEGILESKRQKFDVVSAMEMDSEVPQLGPGSNEEDRMDETRADALRNG